MLAINLLLVGIAYWTQLGAATAEARESDEAPVPTPPAIAKTPIEPDKSNAPEAKVLPQAKSPVSAAVLSPKIDKAPTSPEPPKVASPTPHVSIPAGPAKTSLPENAIPGLVRLVNPSDSGGAVYYAVGGTSFSLNPGEYHEISQAAECLVEFHRGGDFGYAKLELKAGDYRFSVGAAGWNLASGKSEPVSALIRAH